MSDTDDLQENWLMNEDAIVPAPVAPLSAPGRSAPNATNAGLPNLHSAAPYEAYKHVQSMVLNSTGGTSAAAFGGLSSVPAPMGASRPATVHGTMPTGLTRLMSSGMTGMRQPSGMTGILGNMGKGMTAAMGPSVRPSDASAYQAASAGSEGPAHPPSAHIGSSSSAPALSATTKQAAVEKLLSIMQENVGQNGYLCDLNEAYALRLYKRYGQGGRALSYTWYTQLTDTDALAAFIADHCACLDLPPDIMCVMTQLQYTDPWGCITDEAVAELIVDSMVTAGFNEQQLQHYTALDIFAAAIGVNLLNMCLNRNAVVASTAQARTPPTWRMDKPGGGVSIESAALCQQLVEERLQEGKRGTFHECMCALRSD